MITTNHTTLRMSGVLNIEHLTALKLHVGVNAHGWATVEGEAGENALEQLSGALAGREQHILTLDESGTEKCLFAGVIREAEMVRVGGYNRFHVELLSGTCLMDREVRSRSFQDVGRTYSQVAQQVCSEYSGGAAICTVGEDKTLGQPVIQYRETDWEFLMRMASHCSGVLVPETHRGLPRLWFGFPDRSYTCEFPEDAYTSGISQRYYELGGSAAGYSKADFFYYDVESPQLCDLGWYTVFKGQPFIIAEKSARLERGELIFTYRLGRPSLGWGKMLYNEKISGMTLLGEVLETSRETLKLKLDIDAGWDPGGPYPYTWRPETGNFMYCMPKVGTRVSLYCPNFDERAAVTVNCVRTNGDSCSRMSNPAKRSFVTEHGKEMNLYPEEMSLVGSTMDSIWGKILVSDDEGVSINSPKPIYVIAKEDVMMESSTVHTQTVNGEIVTATCNPQAGSIKAGMVQSGLYDLNAAITNVIGSNCVEYSDCNDGLQEAEFDKAGWWQNIAIGCIAVAAFAVAFALTGGLAAVAAGSVAAGVFGGGMVGAVAGTAIVAIQDRCSGNVRSRTSAFLDIAGWTLLGASVGANVGSVYYAIKKVGWDFVKTKVVRTMIKLGLRGAGISSFMDFGGQLLLMQCGLQDSFDVMSVIRSGVFGYLSGSLSGTHIGTLGQYGYNIMLAASSSLLSVDENESDKDRVDRLKVNVWTASVVCAFTILDPVSDGVFYQGWGKKYATPLATALRDVSIGAIVSGSFDKLQSVLFSLKNEKETDDSANELIPNTN